MAFSELEPGLFLVEKEIFTARGGHGSDISGPYWMLIESELIAGEAWWLADGVKVFPEQKRHFLFVPPYSWSLDHYGKGAELKIRGIISRQAIRVPYSEPVLFSHEKPLPRRLGEFPAFLSGVKKFTAIGICSRPSALSARAKRLLDQEFSLGIELKEVASRLKTQPAALSRRFKSDFGLSPAFYRKGLKVTVGMYELMMGTSPAEAAARAGYNDLGRFYKQFKAYLKETPGDYKKSKNAKKARSRGRKNGAKEKA